MEKNNRTEYPFRAAAVLLLLISLLLTLAACGGNNANSRVLGSERQVIYGYITDCDRQARSISVDEVELVSSGDFPRVNQLGLAEDQFRSGYYAYNADTGARSYAVAENVRFYRSDPTSASSNTGYGSLSADENSRADALGGDYATGLDNSEAAATQPGNDWDSNYNWLRSSVDAGGDTLFRLIVENGQVIAIRDSGFLLNQ